MLRYKHFRYARFKLCYVRLVSQPGAVYKHLAKTTAISQAVLLCDGLIVAKGSGGSDWRGAC